MADLRSFLQVISTFKLWLQAEACFRCRRALFLYVLRVRQHWFNQNKIVILQFLFLPMPIFNTPMCYSKYSNFFSCEKLSDFTMFCGPENWPTQLSVNYKACQMRAYQMLRSLPETALNFVWSTPSEELCLSQSAGRAVNQYFKDISEFYFYSESRHCILAISTNI